jgi:hypothetical protein
MPQDSTRCLFRFHIPCSPASGIAHNPHNHHHLALPRINPSQCILEMKRDRHTSSRIREHEKSQKHHCSCLPGTLPPDAKARGRVRHHRHLAGGLSIGENAQGPGTGSLSCRWTKTGSARSVSHPSTRSISRQNSNLNRKNTNFRLYASKSHLNPFSIRDLPRRVPAAYCASIAARTLYPADYRVDTRVSKIA